MCSYCTCSQQSYGVVVVNYQVFIHQKITSVTETDCSLSVCLFTLHPPFFYFRQVLPSLIGLIKEQKMIDAVDCCGLCAVLFVVCTSKRYEQALPGGIWDKKWKHR